MSISSTRPVEPKPELVDQVQRTIEEILKNPEALALARLQHIVMLAQKHQQVRECLNQHIVEVAEYARSLGHEVI